MLISVTIKAILLRSGVEFKNRGMELEERNPDYNVQ
jgi:hypothetical protein